MHPIAMHVEELASFHLAEQNSVSNCINTCVHISAKTRNDAMCVCTCERFLYSLQNGNTTGCNNTYRPACSHVLTVHICTEHGLPIQIVQLYMCANMLQDHVKLDLYTCYVCCAKTRQGRVINQSTAKWEATGSKHMHDLFPPFSYHRRLAMCLQAWTRKACFGRKAYTCNIPWPRTQKHSHLLCFLVVTMEMNYPLISLRPLATCRAAESHRVLAVKEVRLPPSIHSAPAKS